MSKIGKNIKKIRSIKKLSQADFGELFDISRASVGAYEEERAEPKIDTIRAITSYFGVSFEQLLFQDLTVNALYNFDIFDQKTTKKNSTTNFSSKEKKSNTIYVSKEKRSYFLQNLTKKTSIDSLETFYFPHQKEKLFLFEHDTNELFYQERGIANGDFVLASKILPKNISPTRLYVFATKDDLIIRRVKSVGSTFTLASDHPSYSPSQILINDIIDCWEVTGYFSQHLPIVSNLEHRISKIEQNFKK